MYGCTDGISGNSALLFHSYVPSMCTKLLASSPDRHLKCHNFSHKNSLSIRIMSFCHWKHIWSNSLIVKQTLKQILPKFIVSNAPADGITSLSVMLVMWALDYATGLPTNCQNLLVSPQCLLTASCGLSISPRARSIWQNMTITCILGACIKFLHVEKQVASGLLLIGK